jgi:hypothetical protein
MTETAMPNAKLMRYILLYTAGVALLVFVINRALLGAPLQSSLMWTAMFAAIAFAMAWRHATQKKL